MGGLVRIPTPIEFIGKASMSELDNGGAIFGTTVNNDKVVVAEIGGLLRNITSFIGEDEYTSKELGAFKIELTRFVCEAINEKIERGL